MKAVCIAGRTWIDDFGSGETTRGPVLNEVVCVSGNSPLMGWEYLAFREYPPLYFRAKHFRPLLGDEQESLDAIEEEVKETELIPLEA